MPGSNDKGRILIVDDEPEQRELFELILAEDGYAVATAASGDEALALLGGKPFDVVVSDIMMPGLTGIDLLRAIRRHDLDLPVLLLTGSPNLESATRAVNEGALRYLLKPIGPSQLVHEVAAAVRLFGLARIKRDALAHLGRADKLIGDRAGLATAFVRAIESLWMVYQPICRPDGERYGSEALMRNDATPLASPLALLDAAERLGRVVDLGRVIRKRVSETIEVLGEPGLTFVNVHTAELEDERLYHPSAPLTRHAASVVLEITEHASIDDVSEVRSRIRSLKGLDFRIALDDLGAGYAGLTSFAALEPDIVKLDMSLVQGVDREPIRRRLIGSMVSVCKESGILVVAEGVETEAEKRVLIDMGCDLLQGFLLGGPALVDFEGSGRPPARAGH